MILKGFQDRFRTGLRLLKKISNYFSGCFCNILPAGRFEIVQNLYFFLYLWNHQQNSITFICDEMEANWIVNWCITWSVWNWINPLSNRIRLNLSTAEPTDQSFELYFSFLFLFLFLSFFFFFYSWNSITVASTRCRISSSQEILRQLNYTNHQSIHGLRNSSAGVGNEAKWNQDWFELEIDSC